jgi:hypothetical protein
VLHWIQTNPAEFGALLGALVVAVLAGVAGWRLGGLRQGLLQLMLHLDRARRQGRLGPIDGPQVMAMVVTWAMNTLVPRLPFWLRPLITPERLQSWAQALFDAGLDLLDDGMLNGTHPTLPDDNIGPGSSGPPRRTA